MNAEPSRPPEGRVFVAGHNGMVGSAIVRALETKGSPVLTRDRAELDLSRQGEVEDFFESQDIDQVYLAAAKVGGIQANNDCPADFIAENLLIQANIITSAFQSGVKRLLFLGSSCIYPKFAEQPMAEEALLTGPLEPTNEPYAIAKIAGIKMCESYRRQYGCDFRCLMPTNLYGPNDNFDPETSHVLPALLRRFHEASAQGTDRVTVWGSGRPRREFLHVDDLAEACVHFMNLPAEQFWSAVNARCAHVNIGTGIDISIADLARLIARITHFKGDIEFDTSMPDGTPRKLLDVSRATSMGWSATIDLEHGIESVYRWMLEEGSTV
ncbi:MAG: GDP-L-fucose synthase [Xanthomonadales bacterium]|nr:GDP-L-fucose synthase [Xanthomonadales bacterium]